VAEPCVRAGHRVEQIARCVRLSKPRCIGLRLRQRAIVLDGFGRRSNPLPLNCKIRLAGLPECGQHRRISCGGVSLLLTTGDSRAFDSIRGRHGYVLTFENVSNAQWIGSEVGLSPPNIGLLAEPKKAESVTPEKTVHRGGPQDAASSASETSTRIRDFDE
jgi:hypothetical protein